ncbi:g7310 [Coccomyxa viridis]|uniref:G7310 protein n=1 Tax=Coccomyxa viridis TaxID=1274662 RepID=A0ABP1G035_9CHLO
MANDTVELVSSFISPWTLKVVWALAFHKIQYSNVSYTPIAGEGWLRRKTGKNNGLISVPVMFTPEGTLMDSFDIAQWADAHSQRDDGVKLFPAGQLEAIHKWNKASDDILDHWRALLFSRLQIDKEARRQMMPPILNSLGPITDWLSSRRIGALRAKYDSFSKASSATKAEKALQDLRAAVEANNGYVLGALSYADITMAVAANAIEPLGPPISKAPAPMRQPCKPEWRTQYADIVEYRDRIVKEHYPKNH